MTGPVVFGEPLALDDEAIAAVARLQERMRCFVDDMRTRGIHVGFGTPSRCVCCGDPWPCPDSQDGAP